MFDWLFVFIPMPLTISEERKCNWMGVCGHYTCCVRVVDQQKCVCEWNLFLWIEQVCCRFLCKYHNPQSPAYCVAAFISTLLCATHPSFEYQWHSHNQILVTKRMLFYAIVGWIHDKNAQWEHVFHTTRQQQWEVIEVWKYRKLGWDFHNWINLCRPTKISVVRFGWQLNVSVRTACGAKSLISRCWLLGTEILGIELLCQFVTATLASQNIIAYTMQYTNSTYQSSLDTWAWLRNPAPIAATAILYQALPDPTYASCPPDDGTPALAPCDRIACSHSRAEYRWFSARTPWSPDRRRCCAAKYLQR